nr:MAG TPA: hypothetical protein [Caudoviricetes sp.]
MRPSVVSEGVRRDYAQTAGIAVKIRCQSVANLYLKNVFCWQDSFSQ